MGWEGHPELQHVIRGQNRCRERAEGYERFVFCRSSCMMVVVMVGDFKVGRVRCHQCWVKGIGGDSGRSLQKSDSESKCVCL